MSSDTILKFILVLFCLMLLHLFYLRVRCGAQSKRKEFTNLSLDLIPGGSVKEMLQEYVKETELDYKCECGGNTSGQSMAFETLQSVLILHLKRFIYSPIYELVKLHDPVELPRDLVVSSNQGDGCYSLISVVSHCGSDGEAGHYICDSVHPDDSLSQTTDWLTFNDSMVTNTTGASVCAQNTNSVFTQSVLTVFSGVEQKKKIRAKFLPKFPPLRGSCSVPQLLDRRTNPFHVIKTKTGPESHNELLLSDCRDDPVLHQQVKNCIETAKKNINMNHIKDVVHCVSVLRLYSGNEAQ